MKIIIIPLCLIGFAAAGVLDGRWMHDERLNRFKTGYDDRDYGRIDDSYKYGTTKTELDRQKILLKLLDHVHETLKDMDLRTVRDEFDDNEVNYKKSIDQDMLYVIQLHRSGRLLGKHDIFTVLDLTHKRQMIGLKRLLTRAKDIDIFVQNAVTARNRMNGVLFVNALLLAVRERDDTRHLIVPAVHEILPELYVDRETLHKLLNVDMNLLTISNGYETRRPKFHDIMGLHNGIDVLETRGTFWNGLGNLVTRRYNRFDVNDVDDNKLVIDEVEKHVKVKTIKLLTEDVGFKGFLHHLINDICLKENELEKVDGIEWNGMTRRRDWERMRKNTFDKRYHSLDSKEWKNDYHSRDRLYDTIDIDGVLDKSYHQRKLNDLDVTHLDKHCIKCINRKTDKDCRTCLLKTSDDLLNELDYDCKQCIRNINVYDCDKCKMKIERTDLVYRDDDVDDVTNGKLWYGRGGLMDYKTHNQLHTKCIKCIERQNHVDCDECKRFTNDDIMEELDLDCKLCIRHMTYDDCEKCKEKLSTGMIILNQKQFSDSSDKIVELDIVCQKCIKSKSQQLCNMCLNTIDNWTLQRLDHHCKKCIENLDDYSCDKCLVKRDHFVKWNNVDYDDTKKTTTAEVLLHNLRQVLTRINLERLSLDLDTIEDLEVRNGRDDIEIIKTKIMQKLRNTKIDIQRAQIMDIEKLIAKALIKNDNDINLLDILSDIIVSDVKGRGGDMQIVSEIGEALSDDKVIRILRKIFATIDMVRTEILGTYKLHDLLYDDVKIDDIKVLGFETHLKPKDIDMKNLLKREVEKVVIVRQQQLTHNDFNIKIEVEAKRQQRAVMRTFIGPKKVDDMGRMLSLNERRLGYMLLDTKVIDLYAGRNVLETTSHDLIWTKRDTTTLRQIYKRIFLGTTEDVDIIGVGHDCRFPQRLVLPRGHINGAEFELFVIITRLDGDVVMQRSDMTTKCVMGWSDKGVDDKSLGFPFDRLIDVDTRDLRQLDNVVGVDVKIYHDERNGLNWW